MKKKQHQTEKSAFTLSHIEVKIVNKDPKAKTADEDKEGDKRNVRYVAPKTTSPPYIEKKIKMTPFPTVWKIYKQL